MFNEKKETGEDMQAELEPAPENSPLNYYPEIRKSPPKATGKGR